MITDSCSNSNRPHGHMTGSRATVALEWKNTSVKRKYHLRWLSASRLWCGTMGHDPKKTHVVRTTACDYCCFHVAALPYTFTYPACDGFPLRGYLAAHGVHTSLLLLPGNVNHGFLPVYSQGYATKKGKPHYPPKKIKMKNTTVQWGGISVQFCFSPFS